MSEDESFIAEVNNLIKKENLKNNLFAVLGLETTEMIHSRFIAFLLAPNGKLQKGKGNIVSSNICHSYKAQFLEKFLIIMGIKFGNKNLEKAEVYIEYFANKHSRPDILIKIGNQMIIIENKINAKDREKQLDKYSKYLKDNKNNQLLYLTLDGHEAITKVKDYKIIDYGMISEWLAECIKISNKTKELNSSIIMYKSVIDSMTVARQIITELDSKKDWTLITKLLSDKQINKEMEKILQKHVYPYIIQKYVERDIKRLLVNELNFYPENNYFFLSKWENESPEYDIFITFEKEGLVSLYCLKIISPGEWKFGIKGKGWESWKKSKPWKEEKINDFMKELQNGRLKRVLEDMKKYIDSNKD